jgi:hypothetical protein
MKQVINKNYPESVLTNQNKEDFWIRCLLGSGKGEEFFTLSINRAYRDLNRTIHGLGSIEPDRVKSNHFQLTEQVRESVNCLMNVTFDNQEQFDVKHQKECETLVEKFNQFYSGNPKLHIGQAQKWINMSLKYISALGSERHNGNLDNYQFFHIPIDNIIQEKLLKHEITPIKTKWSRINDYGIYLQYQNKVREFFIGKIPLDVEFLLFNDEEFENDFIQSKTEVNI